MTALSMLPQTAAAPATQGDWVDSILAFLDSPAPYSPFTEYLLVLFILWLLARRVERKKESFEAQAQKVLDEKLETGELTREAYDKFRQDMALRPKR
ncbi:MAG TPA: hypothetical protein VFZ69_01540 [Longimicrobiales bacterium]